MSASLHPEWLGLPEVKTLAAAFAEHKVPLRFVGGCVRDALLGKAAHDLDAATPLAPEHVMDLLRLAHIRAIPTGLAHGTVTALVNARPFEITTLRKDVGTDGRHAEVEYTEDWEEDAARRDFTINALYLSPQGELFDYFNGRDDLADGVVRFIGDAETRIKEDYLRILRFFRFYARYGKTTPDAEALAACAALASGMAKLSGERIQDEMFKILCVPSVFPALLLMQQTGVLAQVMGARIEALDVFSRLEKLETDSGREPHIQLRLALLLMHAEEDASAALERITVAWKLSNATHGRLKTLLELAPLLDPALPLAAQKKYLRRYGTGVYQQAVLLRWATADAAQASAYQAMLSLAESWTPPAFTISGDDLKALGFAEGKQLGALLRQLEEMWEESGYALSKEALLGEAKKRA